MSIADRLATLSASLPAEVTLVAVSKTKPASAIQEAYAAGHRHFGENRVQELIEKAPQFPKDVVWHFIGHLQTKKVKQIAAHASVIHSIDSEKLLVEVNKRAAEHNRVIDCLVQVHIAEESTKFGFSVEEATTLLTGTLPATLPNVRITGLMGMATFTNNQEQVANEFAVLAGLFNHLKSLRQTGYDMQVLSMGMSGDYKLAIQQSSTMIRIGTAIFGSRG